MVSSTLFTHDSLSTHTRQPGGDEARRFRRARTHALADGEGSHGGVGRSAHAAGGRARRRYTPCVCTIAPLNGTTSMKGRANFGSPNSARSPRAEPAMCAVCCAAHPAAFLFTHHLRLSPSSSLLPHRVPLGIRTPTNRQKLCRVLWQVASTQGLQADLVPVGSRAIGRLSGVPGSECRRRCDGQLCTGGVSQAIKARVCP